MTKTHKKHNLPLKTPGGKCYLASRIVDLFPRHIHFVEPFCGGCAVLLARDPLDERFWLPPHKGVSELVNDIDKDLQNFWRVLQGLDSFAALKRICEATPLSRIEWHDSDPVLNQPDDMDCYVVKAWRFFVRCRQSMAGMRKTFTPITRTRLRRGMNGNVSEWLGAIDGLQAVHERLQRVVIENMDGIDLICREDTPNTLFYIDSPYLHSTRTTTDLYQHEMTDEQHQHLLSVLVNVKGKVLLSGYPSDLYDNALAGWKKHVWNMPNHAAGGATKKRMLECLWQNF